MRLLVTDTIIQDPPPEEANTITVIAKVEGYNLFYRGSSFVEEFIDEDWDGCRNKEELEYFLMESGINDDMRVSAMINLTLHVIKLTSCPIINFSPEWALQVDLTFHYIPQIEEAIRVSFDDASNFRLKPANKLVVKSLPRKIYEEISSTGETCTICLEEFTNGGRLVTLPCGHEFDDIDECAVKWFETNHFCPLCRHMLPCEYQ